MLEVQRIRVSSAIKVSIALHIALYWLAGIVVTLLYAVVHSVILRSFFSSSISALTLLLIWLAGTLIVILHGLLFGWFVAAFYNLIASWWGGIVCEIRTVSDDKAVVTVPATGTNNKHHTSVSEPEEEEKADTLHAQKQEQKKEHKHAAPEHEHREKEAKEPEHAVPHHRKNTKEVKIPTNYTSPTNPTIPTDGFEGKTEDKKERKSKEKREHHNETISPSVPAPLVVPKEPVIEASTHDGEEEIHN